MSWEWWWSSYYYRPLNCSHLFSGDQGTKDTAHLPKDFQVQWGILTNKLQLDYSAVSAKTGTHGVQHREHRGGTPCLLLGWSDEASPEKVMSKPNPMRKAGVRQIQREVEVPFRPVKSSWDDSGWLVELQVGYYGWGRKQHFWILCFLRGGRKHKGRNPRCFSQNSKVALF